MTNTLLPPEEAQRLLEEGSAPTAEIIAHLDLEKCSFGKRVVTQDEPLVRTGVFSFGKPVVGSLAFTPEDIARNKADGAPSILAVTTETYLKALHRRAFFESAEGIICVAPASPSESSSLQMHLPVMCAGYRSVLIDDPTNPTIAANFEKGTLCVCGKESISRGDILTTDPQNGRLWVGQMRIERSPLRLATFFDAVFSVTGVPKISTVAFHQTIYGTWGSVLKLWQIWPEKIYIGLQRTEQELGFECIARKIDPASALAELAKGTVISAVRGFGNQSLTQTKRKNYRFADLHGVKSFLLPEIQQELGDGRDHILGTASFSLRNSMNKLQFNNAIRNSITNSC